MIEVSELTKSYGGRAVVDQLSFQARPGVVTGFLGPNGAGKSTTMRLIAGLERPTSGTARVDGSSYRDLKAPLRRIGILLDAKAVYGARSAFDHLWCLARSNGIGRVRVRAVLRQVGLEEAARRRIAGFSLGMSQRLGIAAALLGDPPVLMLDEPVNGLDPEGIIWIRTLLRSLAAEGRTVLLSSHLMSEMEHTADHLVVVGSGRLIADTSMSALIDGSPATGVQVRCDDPACLAPLLTTAGATVDHGPQGRLLITGIEPGRISTLAAENGVTLHELATHRSSLEEAYLELTRHHTCHTAAL
ncbi:ABC-2 type transport system ATP-binding protein [Kitasatospora sp. GAS204A]|uniref:ABC transporter ATP-binding protein n=1 Tax=unclassified Kitasatospora TaxID=2633591 RepID=UPI00247387B6|nr:ABC transporter ATP-binding protein [Kitasatospora sp. GAS204B]MDH6122892.1 ABC-2 type transport system ATP-binding protein [Kitasatospora sp. GAS204B]